MGAKGLSFARTFDSGLYGLMLGALVLAGPMGLLAGCDDDDSSTGGDDPAETSAPAPRLVVTISPSAIKADGISVGKVSVKLLNLTVADGVTMTLTTNVGTWENQRSSIKVPFISQTAEAQLQAASLPSFGLVRASLKSTDGSINLLVDNRVQLLAADPAYYSGDRLPRPSAVSVGDDDDDAATATAIVAPADLDFDNADEIGAGE